MKITSERVLFVWTGPVSESMLGYLNRLSSFLGPDQYHRIAINYKKQFDTCYKYKRGENSEGDAEPYKLIW